MTWPKCLIHDSGVGTFFLETPFDEGFVQAIKRLPEEGRRWDSDMSAWEIDWDHYEQVQTEVKRAFDQFAQEAHP